MKTDNISISLELLFLNDLLQAEAIDESIFNKASSLIMKEASANIPGNPV